MTTLKINVDTTAIDEAREAIEAIADAAERAQAALDKLNGDPHGGVEVTVAGKVAFANVMPHS